MGVYYELGTLLGPKSSLPTLAALGGNLFCLYSASPRRQNDHITTILQQIKLQCDIALTVCVNPSERDD